MKKLAIVLVCATAFASCSKKQNEQAQLTEAQIAYKVDSIFTIKKKEIMQQSAKDLQLRLKIEVKPKRDSIQYAH